MSYNDENVLSRIIASEGQPTMAELLMGGMMRAAGASSKRASLTHFTRSRRPERGALPSSNHHNISQWLLHSASALDKPVSKPGSSIRVAIVIVTLDAPGATYLAYTPNGKKLVTAGVDNYCRVFTTGSDDEPVTIDECQENNTAVVAGVLNTTWSRLRQCTDLGRRMATSLPAQKTAQ